MSRHPDTLRLAVVRDFRAENWPSMDLCADQLLAHLPDDVRGVDVAPDFRHVLGRVPGSGGVGFNADRLLNRHLLLPRQVRRLARDADVYHIADHSYAHLALSLPPGKTGVFCHDLDSFRCLLDPAADRRPRWFRAMAGRILCGFQRAAVVFHNSAEVGRQLRTSGLVRPDRLIHAPLGVATEFTAAETESVVLPGRLDGPFLLHVGGDMPRKRLDVLFAVAAAVRATRPDVRLVQVGPPWSADRERQIVALGLATATIKLTGLSRAQLAAVYRRAAAVLVPSEAEGFGLPVVEALACGAPVIASDLPVLREVGGAVCSYAPVGDVPAWTAAVIAELGARTDGRTRAARLEWSARYTWAGHAARIAESYRYLPRFLRFSTP